ncbi:MAG: hypothetical protein ACOCV3_00405 [Halanaerobiales bacterium]
MKDFMLSVLFVLLFGILAGAVIYLINTGIGPSIPTDAIKI